ncbi:cytochrome P450 [Xylaria bambusicola]|uniref:cytochrome P450 n=1 Tax=Xylaria bambusicola TaxID=326684 RepID=UPI0020076E8F|nr:cytochrome P450 [Xylaria bambusicola]KAI0502864.1 cytochrome P450 [Xylaria bambusicola]
MIIDRDSTYFELFPYIFIVFGVYVAWGSVFQHGPEEWWMSQPSIGTRKEAFSWVRSMLRSVVSTQDWVLEGYTKYSKRNTYFTVPIMDRARMTIIPQAQLREIYSLPETILDAVNTNSALIQSPWTIWDSKVAPNDSNILVNTIRNRITRSLGVLTPRIAAELNRGFEREWGSSTGQWKTIHAWDSPMSIIAGAANSAFYGLPLCRNIHLLARLQIHAKVLFFGSVLLNCTPPFLRFIPGYFIAWTCYIIFRSIAVITSSEINKRLRDTAQRREGSNKLEAPPEDALQWCIEESYATGDLDHLKPLRVALRLVYLNDISTHSTSFTAANVILDLACSDPSLGYIAALREESARVLKAANGAWTREAVSELKLIDSTIRESMRMSPFNSIGVPRTVVDAHGIVVRQGNSIMKLPQGTIIGLPVTPVQYDEEFYPNAKEFNPFRFVSDAIPSRDPCSLSGTSEKSAGTKRNEKTSVMIDEHFLHFGFGKHACPGRFFALQEVKLFVAHMVLHYDIEHLAAGRPKMKSILWLNAPILGNFNVRVRKRDPVELNY